MDNQNNLENGAGGRPAEISLTTYITQGGDMSTFSFNEEGQLFQMGDALYLRFEEHSDENPQPIPVTIKINNQGRVKLSRAGENDLQLYFIEGKRVEARYQTPYGMLPIDTETPRLNIKYNDRPFSGNVNIDYNLYAGKELLGMYKIRLHFTV